MLSVWGTKKFKMAKYMPYGFYLTGKTKEPRSWSFNVYSEGSTWSIHDHTDADWNKMGKEMKVGNEGTVFNFMGGVILQLPK